MHVGCLSVDIDPMDQDVRTAFSVVCCAAVFSVILCSDLASRSCTGSTGPNGRHQPLSIIAAPA